MSGIKKTTNQQQEKRRNGPKPTLEDNYLETREAAEAFQILQVGICCVEEDREKGIPKYSYANIKNNNSVQDSTLLVHTTSTCPL